MKKNVILVLYAAILVTAAQPVFAQKNIAKNRAVYQSSAANYNNTAHLVTDGQLSTNWQSKTATAEWVYVDLGAVCEINEIRIYWDSCFAVQYKIQISSSGRSEKPENWNDIYFTKEGKGGTETIRFKPKTANYVRLFCLKPFNKNGYSLKEFEVHGKGEQHVKNTAIPKITADSVLFLHGGNWKLQRELFVKESGAEISKPSYNDTDWIAATVPGTILASYYNVGAIPDMLYGDQQLQISESFFTANFWYRNSFEIPTSYAGKRVWLNFDGINWKAEIYVNGAKIGRIDGAYIRGKFDITDFVKFNQENSLAVLVYKNDNPGEVTEQHLDDPDGNGGIIGYDSPTILASIGWNWIPTIRGRNTGIWNQVFLSSTRQVSIIDPYIRTDFNLPDTTQSFVYLDVILKNNNDKEVNGWLNGTFGLVNFSYPVHLKANEQKNVSIDKNQFSQFVVKNPKLWWPNGYGNQHLDTLKLQFIANNQISDQKEVVFGFRKYTYTYDNNNLRIHINGVPVLIRGGNWGMSEALLRCNKERYDLLVKMHKDMNLNLIRNWVGMVGDAAFYESCDKYGIMIWDDFWLANPVDGPHPNDNNLFMTNVTDKIKQRRNHASLAIWAGRNEGYPPAVLDSAMRVCLSELDNSRHYVSSSAHWPVTGLGPYETKDPKWYFENRGTTFHTEQGIVCVPPAESLKEMMPEEYLWPINDMWGKHDWTQPRVKIYTNDLENSYGKATNLEDFCKKAQMMNMEGPKAMMETWQSNRGGGVIVWMTHPAWPSLICQTYDYYFEPTAAYFAFKKGSEPLHVLWRADNNKVQVANNLQKSFGSLQVKAFVYDLSGNKIIEKNNSLEVLPNSVTDFFALEIPETISQVHFIKLQLVDSEGNVLSDNFYWRSSKYMDYKLLNSLPKVLVKANASQKTEANTTTLKINVTNNSANIALMLRLKVVQSKSGKRVLPAFYQDNYFSLVPNEQKTVEIQIENNYLQGDNPEIIIEGWNIISQKIKPTQ